MTEAVHCFPSRLATTVFFARLKLFESISEANVELRNRLIIKRFRFFRLFRRDSGKASPIPKKLVDLSVNFSENV